MGYRDTGYLPFYFQGYRILSILLPRICITVFIIFVTFRDVEYLGKLVMRVLACMGYLVPPVQASHVLIQ